MRTCRHLEPYSFGMKPRNYANHVHWAHGVDVPCPLSLISCTHSEAPWLRGAGEGFAVNTFCARRAADKFHESFFLGLSTSPTLLLKILGSQKIVKDRFWNVVDVKSWNLHLEILNTKGFGGLIWLQTEPTDCILPKLSGSRRTPLGSKPREELRWE